MTDGDTRFDITMGVDVGDHQIRGALIGGEPVTMMRYAEADFTHDDDASLSLALAELTAVLLKDHDSIPIAVTTRFDDARIEPIPAAFDIAQFMANRLDRPVRMSTGADTSVLAEAAAVDRLRDVVRGAGVQPNRVDYTPRVLAVTTISGTQFERCEVPRAFYRRYSNVRVKGLAGCVGVALALMYHDRDSGLVDLRAKNIEPEGRSDRRWVVVPAAVPIDFETPRTAVPMQLIYASLFVALAILFMLILTLTR